VIMDNRLLSLTGPAKQLLRDGHILPQSKGSVCWLYVDFVGHVKTAFLLPRC
jgi:hypothetical protein